MISNTTVKVNFDVLGGYVASYPFTFRWFGGDMKCRLTKVDGSTVDLVEGVDYSVSGPSDKSSGTVTRIITAAWVAAATLTIYRASARTQLVDFRNNDIMDAEILEATLDRSVATLQEQEDKLGRQITIPITDPTIAPLPTKAARANTWFGFDSAGDPLAMTGGPATMSPADILAAVETVDGAGSGLDADLLDGAEGSAYHQKELTTPPGTPWGLPTIYLRDTLRAAVEAASGGRNTVLYDDQGNPSYMVVIPRFDLTDLHATDYGSGPHPAFVVNGVTKPYIMIGQVQASAGIGSRACSIPGRDPWCSINYDDARAACVAKGAGWHLMTNWEWAAIAEWCVKNGFQPRGNSQSGKSHAATWEWAPPGGYSGRTLGGLGPASWRHDNTPVGIADLVGNVWEWVDGLRLNAGTLYMQADNWYERTLAELPTTGRTISSGGGGAWTGATLGGSGYADTLMKAALILPATSNPLGSYWTDLTLERVPIRGGVWSDGANDGLAALNLGYARSNVFVSFGFRPAFIP